MNSLRVFSHSLLITAILFLLPSISQGQSLCTDLFSGPTIQTAISDLVALRYYRSQEDPFIMNGRNGRKKMMIEDGGLCGPASAHIILAGLDRLSGRKSNATSIGEIVRLTDVASFLTK